MLKTLLITMLLLTSYTTTAQVKHNVRNEEITMELFNIKLFNKNKDSSNNEWNFTLTDGTEIKRSKDVDNEGIYYIEQRIPLNSAYTYFYTYNEQGILSETSTQLYSNMYINTRESYNNKGQVIDIEDYDEPYPFSIDDLKKKMQNEYGVDILDINQIARLVRAVVENPKDHLPQPIYEVYYYKTSNPNQGTFCLIIDGTTGKTLYQTSRAARVRRKLTPYQEYLESLQETKPVESDRESE